MRVVCDGCNVREPFEHRCHQRNILVQGERIDKLCCCWECLDVIVNTVKVTEGPGLQDLSMQPPDIQRACQVLAEIRQCDPATAWKKVLRIAEILGTTTQGGLVFCVESTQFGNFQTWSE